MPQLVGAVLPELALPSTMGGTVNLATIEAPAVVFLYPYTGRPGVADPPGWDDIPGAHGSTPEARGFATMAAEYRAAGLEVYGLSGQTRDWQAEFAARLGLPFALLSDERLALASALDLPIFETGGQRFLGRLTLVTRAGEVLFAVHPIVDPGSHADELFSFLQSAALRRG